MSDPHSTRINTVSDRLSDSDEQAIPLDRRLRDLAERADYRARILSDCDDEDEQTLAILLGTAAELPCAIAELTRLRDECDRLSALLNTPELHDFATAVVLEAAHQRERWGIEHDAGKEPQDWFWVVGYLAGKALRSHGDGNVEKALHHTISTAAVLANWHAHVLTGSSSMRPGMSPEKQASADEMSGRLPMSPDEPLPQPCRACRLGILFMSDLSYRCKDHDQPASRLLTEEETPHGR